MRCDQVQERLSEYLENLLDAESHTSVHDHLSSCVHCQAEAQTLAQTRKAVSDLPSVEPPLGFSQKVMARIREANQKPSLWRRLFLPLMIKIPIHAMAIFLVAGLAVYLYQANMPVQTEVARMEPSGPKPTNDIGIYSQPPASPAPPSLQQKQAQKDEFTSKLSGRRKDLNQEGPPAGASREKKPTEHGADILIPEKEARPEDLGKSPAEEVPVADALRVPAPPSVQDVNYQLIFVPKNPAGKSTELMHKVEDLVKKLGGQYAQAEEMTTGSKQGLATEPQPDRFVKSQTLWLTLPGDRYVQFKTELASLGKVEEAAIAPDMPAGSMSAPKASRETPPLRIKLILQLRKKP